MALADGKPPPLEPPQQPAAIPLGPVDVPAAAAATPPPPSSPTQQQLTRSRPKPCPPKPGVVACVDCCGAQHLRAPRTAQLLAEALQQAAYDRTALDNIAVVVIPLQRRV